LNNSVTNLVGLILISLCLPITAAADAHRADQNSTGTRLTPQTINSQIMHWPYPVYVYLPGDYAATKTDFPVLYALDAESRFNRIADMLDAGCKQVILVAIGATARERREADYSLPRAADYYQFLTQEVIPFAESRYRTDPTNRALSGFSMGGLMTGLAMLAEHPGKRFFNAFIIADGSFWIQEEQTKALEIDLASQTSALPVTLFMTAATRGNFRSVEKFHKLLTARQYQDLNLIYAQVETNHGGAFSPSFKQGIDALYPE
jgi:predicted alpha/beta superfamily hydrolase